jgi:hypothetical protein
MSREIRIDDPGAGEWVMLRVKGYFMPGVDHSFTTHRDGKIIGGFALCQYLGNSITVHMAGEDKHWCSRDLLWLVFHYAFVQIGCYKVLAPLRSDQSSVIAMDTRAGWNLEAVVHDAYEKGVHLIILGMTRDSCPWLRDGYVPKFLQHANERAA